MPARASTEQRISAILLAEMMTRHQPSLTLAAAQMLAQYAEAEARRLAVPVVIAVADTEGQPLLLHRMDGSLPASVGLATAKARTAAAYRMATEVLGELAQPGGALFGLGQGDGAVLFGGGLPCPLDGVVIGAIGISGGTVAEDIHIARHARDSFLDRDKTASAEGLGR